MSSEIILRSSYANVYCDKATGNIIRIDYEAMGGVNEWDDVERFDPTTFPDESETDILSIGGWNRDGVYFEPVIDQDGLSK